MKKYKFTEKLPVAFKISLFISLTVLISLLLPTETGFKYGFELGKPWTYELMTAPFDFPIYKTESQLKSENTKALKEFTPYYNIDTTVAMSQYSKFIADHKNEPSIKFIHITTLLKKKFEEIYSIGILSMQSDKSDLSQIRIILPNRTSKIVEIKTLYTPKAAYESLVSIAPAILKNMDLNVYIKENVIFDSIKSEIAKNDLLKNISITSGMVQQGERIIDRGEIIDEGSFQILSSLKIEFDKRKTTIQRSALETAAEIFIISGLIFLFFLYVYLFRPRIFENNKNLVFLSLLILIVVALASLVIQNSSASYYLIPYALLPIIIRVFYDSRTALFGHIITTMIVSLMVDEPYKFMFMQIVIGMAAVSSLKDMTQRSQLAQTAFIAFLSYFFLHISFEFMAEGDLTRMHWKPILYYAASSAFMLFGYLLIYLFEKLFGLISAITLVELTNINSDLMLQFAEKAPGTFQHTLQVSNLATEAAKKIGCNSLLVRTGALYHDIGKMVAPENFTENQFGGHNPLNELELVEAANRIIKHVGDGVEIAKKHHLPEQIINFITTHHGTSKTKYFYNTYINQHSGIVPDENAFTYPGPLPNSKETAILMMADAVEARSRSLVVYTDETISKMVDDMINVQIADGQFKEAPISFRDVEAVKNIFKEKIKNMYHTRISYPEIKKA